MMTIDDYIRKSYKGGWCYVKEDKAKKIIPGGITIDVNSLYPSQMHSESGNRYPWGEPELWRGNFIPEKAWKDDIYFFVRFRCRFYLKAKHLPTIQIKGVPGYRGTQWLSSSKVFNKEDGCYYEEFRDDFGNIRQARPLLTMTKPDYILFLEHYHVEDMKIYDGMMFHTRLGMFDDYIDKYKALKETAKGAERELAKLFLNNLYGKFASTTDSSYKWLFLTDYGNLSSGVKPESKKTPGYIPVGSAVTSYARCFTIRAAQANYDRFIYADTDSLHLEGKSKNIKGVTLHDTHFNCWKVEDVFDVGFYVRQKTYLEVVDGEYIIKCAGMPNRCKELLIASFNGQREIENMTPDEKTFLKKTRTIEDFNIGLKVPSKLRPVQVAGGTILVTTTYEMR